MLERVMSSVNIEYTLKKLYDQVSSRVFEALRGRKDLKEILKMALKGENLYYLEEGYEKVKELVEREILFMDPIGREVRFQTKLDERASREILELG